MTICETRKLNKLGGSSAVTLHPELMEAAGIKKTDREVEITGLEPGQKVTGKFPVILIRRRGK